MRHFEEDGEVVGSDYLGLGVEVGEEELSDDDEYLVFDTWLLFLLGEDC